MNGRLRTEIEYRWRAVLIVTLAIVGATFTLLASSPIAGVITILSGAVLTVVLNPAAHSPPRPELSLIAVRETHLHPSELVAEIFEAARGEADQKPQVALPSTSPIVVGRRPLDTDAVVADGIQRARNRAPGRGPMANLTAAISPLMQAKPTDQDFEKFDTEIDVYGEKLRPWVVEIDEYLTERSFILLLEAHLTNPAKLDAEDARVVVRFPSGFSSPEELPEGREPPAPPSFPYRESPLQRMIGPTAGYGFSPSPMPIIGQVEPLNMRKQLRNPSYELLSNGELEVNYRRQTIHHGEFATAGEPMIVIASKSGEHQVAWEIHAKNLSSARQGFVTITCASDQLIGEPIKTLGDLEAVLDDLVLDSD